MKYLASKYQGETLFLLGGGESLRSQDLSFLDEKYTFGFNTIFRIFTPTFYLVEDPLFAEDYKGDISSLQKTTKFFGKYLQPLLGELSETHWINVYYEYSPYPGFPHFSKNAKDILWVGGHPSYLCLQLAFYMGFETVYLVGFDHHYPKKEGVEKVGDLFHSPIEDLERGKRWKDPKPERIELAYKKAQLAFKSVNRNIINITASSNLDLFEKKESFSFL
jgi:hypothetical protein